MGRIGAGSRFPWRDGATAARTAIRIVTTGPGEPQPRGQRGAGQDAHIWPGWAYGDTFLVHPGPASPIDSLRAEASGDSLQDYALLETAGIARDDPLIAPPQTFEDFPKTERWLTAARRKALRRAAAL